MLVRRVWPSRPTFDSPFADFDSVRREMLRLLDSAAGDTFGEVGAGVFPPMNITQGSTHGDSTGFGRNGVGDSARTLATRCNVTDGGVTLPTITCRLEGGLA